MFHGEFNKLVERFDPLNNLLVADGRYAAGQGLVDYPGWIERQQSTGLLC